MGRCLIRLCLFAVVSLTLALVFPEPDVSCEELTITLTGQLRDGLSVPTRVDVDSQGNLYVADVRKRSVVRFDRHGIRTGSFFFASISGAGVAVAHDGSRLYVSCGKSVAILSAVTGDLLGSLGEGDNEFGAAGFIDLDQQGLVFVADTQMNVVKVFDPQGEFLYQFGDPSSSSGTFPSIFALAVDSSKGEVYVADSMIDFTTYPKVQVLDSTGRLLRSLPAATAFGPVLTFFGGMTFDDSNRGYFLDAACSEVRILNLPNEFILRCQKTDSFGRWIDAAFEPITRRLYIACENGRIDVFRVNDGPIAPEAPKLVGPLDDNESIDGNGQLAWEAVTASDGGSIRYVLEISADNSFSTILLEETVDANFVSLSDLANYLALEDGQIYYWRVKALNDNGLVSEPSAVGSFQYNTVVLSVTANMPDARVYLGGNHGYPGCFKGKAPLEIRDLPPGPCSVVVERAGFEPYVTQVRSENGKNVSVYARMVPAITPDRLTAQPLNTVNKNFQMNDEASPFLVDYDNDGIIDLLAGDASGDLILFKGAIIEKEALVFDSGHILGLPVIYGACPFVVDWNNDGRKDLLAGAKDGTVTLFLNTESENAPVFDKGSALIHAGAHAVPAVDDFDSDGDKDLVVGCASGKILLFRNNGSDKVPQLAPAEAILSLSVPAAPMLADWNADGRKDLLVGTRDGAYLYIRQTDGSFTPGRKLSGEDCSHLFALDLDGEAGKDLIAGASSGEVFMVSSRGNALAAAFWEAMNDKALQVEQLMTADYSPKIQSMFIKLKDALRTGDTKEACDLAGALAALAPEGTPLAAAAGELADFFE